jgi:hypothetical protein
MLGNYNFSDHVDEVVIRLVPGEDGDLLQRRHAGARPYEGKEVYRAKIGKGCQLQVHN